MNSIVMCVWSHRLAATIAAVVLLAACSKPVPQAEPIRAVKLMTVGVQAVQRRLEYAGEVKARVESRLAFRVGGKIIDRPVEAGQRVKAGQLLAQLDPQDLKLAADAGRAQLATARTNRDLAEADFKRYSALKDQNFISGAELERRAAVRNAAQAQLDQAQAQLAGQGNQASYAALRADVSGVVTAVLAERGQVVAAGSPVFQIAQDGARDVVFAVPEDKVVAIKPGSEVQVRAWSSGAMFKGRVREVAASADPVTRTFLVKAALSGDHMPALGSTVAVLPQALGRSAVPVIKLPTSALRQDGAATAVWLFDAASMTVNLVPVQVVTADGNDVVVVGGLAPGMQVVVAGVHVLQAGQKVTVYKQNMPLAPVVKAQAAINKIPPVTDVVSGPSPAVSK